MRLLVPLLSTVALAVAPGIATASSVTAYDFSYEVPKSAPGLASRVEWTADPGETNRVVLSDTPLGVVLRDAAGPIRALRGCTALPDGGAVCAAIGDDRGFRLVGGDGDDQLLTNAGNAAVAIDGGEGADTIVAAGPTTRGTQLDGGPGDDTVFGGDGPDRFSGGAGADNLVGGPGNDTLVDDPAEGPFANDRIDGGVGSDTAAYARTTAVRVDLGTGVGGGEADADRLIAVENATGGRADDVLIGDDGPNFLDAGSDYDEGDDRVEGLGDDDSLRGGGGENLLLGGAGDDDIASSGGTADGGAGNDSFYLVAGLARCGDGVDRLERVSQRGTVAADCERLDLDDARVSGVRVSERGLRLTVGPWASYYPPGCGARVKLRAADGGGRLLAHRFVPLRRGQRRTIELRAALPLPARVRLVVLAVACRGGGPVPGPRGGLTDGFLWEPPQAARGVVPFG